MNNFALFGGCLFNFGFGVLSHIYFPVEDGGTMAVLFVVLGFFMFVLGLRGGSK